jgi:hypothetical protein
MSMSDLGEMKARYDQLTQSLKDALPAVCNVIGNVQIVKKQVLDMIQQLNGLVMSNSQLIARANPTIQTRIRAIPVDVAYIREPDVTLSELQDLRSSYAQTLKDLQRFLNLQSAQASTKFPSLDGVQTAFRRLYNRVNLSLLTPRARDFVDQLYRYQANAIIVRNTDEAIAAYTNGLDVLASVLPAAQPTVSYTDLEKLQQLVSLFESEFGLRNLSRAISNDQLALTTLKMNARDLRTSTDLTDDQVNAYIGSYRQGIQILRLYPLK